LGQTIDMLYGPACGFRNDLGGDKLAQACGQLYYFELFLWFRIAVLMDSRSGLPDGHALRRVQQGWPAPLDVLHYVGRKQCKPALRSGAEMRITLAGSRWNKGKHLG
jgi:hypothetical protein